MNSSHPFTPLLFCALGLFLITSSCVAPVTPPPSTPTASNTFTPSLTATEAPTQTPWVITTSPQATESAGPGSGGIIILSLPDGGYYHLFAYSPETLPLTRLTADPWDDITPAISPDGSRVAYASRQNGYWDLFLLNLQDGIKMRLTDTLAYEAFPSWAPDGSWLVYESYQGQSLEIEILSTLDEGSKPIRLTTDNFLDSSPTWSPLGRQVAFVSDRSGEPEIWIADLDHASSDQFVNVSQSPGTVESHPIWSPDGARLSWASVEPSSGLTSLRIWDARTPGSPAVRVGFGDWPIWLDNDHLATRLMSPGQIQLVGYEISSGLLSLPPVLLPGNLEGLSSGSLTASLPGVFQAVSQLTPTQLFLPKIDPDSNTIPDRTGLVDLTGVQAAYPQLSDAVDEAFTALRSRVALETGWDALSSLENAFVPLNTPLAPGLEADWLYTGRAFTINPALIQAGWMVVVLEEYGQEIWWRIYLRTAALDGSQGRPLKQLPWDFSARTGSSQAYENGGALMDSIPDGYWLDLTSLAAQYGWERLPALSNWRSYYNGAHFNELVFVQGTSWRAAMLELYPPEALLTPTVVIPPTRTPTRTPLYYRSPTPTRTPTPRPTSTP